MRRQAEGLSKDGAAMAVEPTQIQLSNRWREIESKFAQFRRLNFAQIVSCYWQTHVCVCSCYSNNSGLLTKLENNKKKSGCNFKLLIICILKESSFPSLWASVTLGVNFSD